MNNPIIYIVLNGELQMSPGKAAAQAVHAAMMLCADSREDFLSDYKRTVIVLEAKNALQILGLCTYLNKADIDGGYYIDEGVNEVDAYSVTALAAFVGDDEALRGIFYSFPLYQGHIEVNHVDRLGLTKNTIKVPGGVELESGFAFRALKRESK